MLNSTYMIPDRIRTLRESAGFSQAELSRCLHVSRNSIIAWEMGTATPTSQYIVAMCKIFHVSADYLLGLERKATLVLDEYSDEEMALVMNLIQYIDSHHA